LDCSADSGVISNPLKGHNGTVRVVKFCPSSSYQGNLNGTDTDTSSEPLLVASGGAGDFRPRVWDMNTGTVSASYLVVLTVIIRGRIKEQVTDWEKVAGM
jgi:hypothetical protein